MNKGKISIYLFFASITMLFLASCMKEELANEQKDNFIKYFGGIQSNEGLQVAQLSDGNFIILGTSSNSDKKGLQIYLAKTDVYGNEIWHKEFGDSTDDKACELKILEDGNFLILGNTTLNVKNTVITNPILIKTEKNGEIIFNQRVSSDLNITSQSFLLKDTSIIITGSYYDGSQNNPAIITTNASGLYPLVKVKEIEGNQNLKSIISNGANFYCIGSVSGTTDTKGASDIFFIAFNGKKWFSPFNLGSSGTDYGKIIKNLNDSTFICLATLTAEGDSGTNIALMKLKITDEEPKIVWSKSYGTFNNEDATGFEITDSGYAVCGTTTNSDGSTDIIAVITDKEGNKLNQKIFGGQGNQKAGAICKTADGGFVVIGTNEYSTSSVIQLLKISKL